MIVLMPVPIEGEIPDWLGYILLAVTVLSIGYMLIKMRYE